MHINNGKKIFFSSNEHHFLYQFVFCCSSQHKYFIRIISHLFGNHHFISFTSCHMFRSMPIRLTLIIILMEFRLRAISLQTFSPVTPMNEIEATLNQMGNNRTNVCCGEKNANLNKMLLVLGFFLCWFISISFIYISFHILFFIEIHNGIIHCVISKRVERTWDFPR